MTTAILACKKHEVIWINLTHLEGGLDKPKHLTSDQNTYAQAYLKMAIRRAAKTHGIDSVCHRDHIVSRGWVHL